MHFAVSAQPLTSMAWPAWRDVVALGKPRLSLLVFCTTGVGLFLAPHSLGMWRTLFTLLATAMVVGAANGLNGYLERDADARMQRTRGRPLPAGRMDPKIALWGSLVVALVSTVALYSAAGPLTALLAFVAFASYVWLYTPMKRVHWAAVLVGAVPGAIPPVMGWVAAEQRLNAGAWALFALLFVWQLPHFLAIALHLQDDYRRGGLVVLPHVIGERATRRWMAALSVAFIGASLLPFWVGIAGLGYAAVALFSSLAFALLCARGLRAQVPRSWAREAFFASVMHMTLLLLALLANGGTR